MAVVLAVGAFFLTLQAAQLSATWPTQDVLVTVSASNSAADIVEYRFIVGSLRNALWICEDTFCLPVTDDAATLPYWKEYGIGKRKIGRKGRCSSGLTDYNGGET